MLEDLSLKQTFKGTKLCFGITPISVPLGEDKGKQKSEVHVSASNT